MWWRVTTCEHRRVAAPPLQRTRPRCVVNTPACACKRLSWGAYTSTPSTPAPALGESITKTLAPLPSHRGGQGGGILEVKLEKGKQKPCVKEPRRRRHQPSLEEAQIRREEVAAGGRSGGVALPALRTHTLRLRCSGEDGTGEERRTRGRGGGPWRGCRLMGPGKPEEPSTPSPSSSNLRPSSASCRGWVKDKRAIYINKRGRAQILQVEIWRIYTLISQKITFFQFVYIGPEDLFCQHQPRKHDTVTKLVVNNRMTNIWTNKSRLSCAVSCLLRMTVHQPCCGRDVNTPVKLSLLMLFISWFN